MCNAFSCIVARNAAVTWKFGVDSHTDLLELAKFKDETSDPMLMEFARVEISPKNNNYLAPDIWELKVDQAITPAWFNGKHKEAALAVHKKWETKLYKILVKKQIVHPFKITPPVITKQHIQLLRKWDSVRASVRASVGDSVWAYIGSFFKIPKWKYIKHPRGQYPFGPAVQLWMLGLVPSFDGTTWRLHGGPKAEVLFSITKEELQGKKNVKA